MSQAAAKLFPLGPYNVYWGNERIGLGKGSMAVRTNKEVVTAGAEEWGIEVLSRKTKEMCEVDVVINELAISRFKYLFDQAPSIASATTLETGQYTATTTVNLRYKEEQELNDETAITVDQAEYVDTGTVQVWKMDMTEEYVYGTSWSGTASQGTVKRITSTAGGLITDGETVLVEYNAEVTASKYEHGGNLADYEAPLRLTHELNNGKVIQFYAYRAKKMGASDVAIQLAAEFDGIPATFKILGDMTKAIGKRFCYWSEES